METSLPGCVKKYFWGDDLSKLNWKDHRHYIMETLLEKGDTEALSWLFERVEKKEVKKKLPDFKLSPKSKNFWEIYLK